MHARGRYGDMLLMLDTCQAATMTEHITAPNVLSLASCQRGENSYAMHGDPVIGVSTVDRFTAAVLSFLAKRMGNETLKDLFQSLQPQLLRSHAVLGNHNYSRNPSEIPCSHFFAAPLHAVRTMPEDRAQDASISELEYALHQQLILRLRTASRPSEPPCHSSKSNNNDRISVSVLVSMAIVATVIFGGATAVFLVALT
jgi:glycosylphosphatidylinositol transamidase (GPIT) subunit GPI8